VILRIKKTFRITSIAFGFVIIFFGGWIFSLFACPLIALRMPFSEKVRRITLRGIGITFDLVLKLNCFTGTLKHIRITGLENIPDKPVLFIANHPSYIDVLVILSQIPYSNCIIKEYLIKNPLSGLMMRSAGYIVNKDGPNLLLEADKSFKSGRSLIIFPEGTRTKGKEMNKFQRGAARIYIKSKPPIVPILIATKPDFMRKYTPWYRLPDTSVEVSVHFEKPLTIPDSVLADPREQMQARELTALFRGHIERGLSQR